MDSKAKEYILQNIKLAINDLQERNFDSMKKLVTRLHTIADVFPDEQWSKELNLTCLIMGAIGGSTEQEFTRMKKEKADELLKNYTEKLNEFYTAVEEESIAKTDNFLKDFADIFFRDVGL